MQNSIVYKLAIETTLDEVIRKLQQRLAKNEQIVSTVVNENVVTVTTILKQTQVLKG